MLLTDFSHIRPAHIHSQEAILDFLAECHTKAGANYYEIKERLLKIGIGSHKIATRGTHLTLTELAALDQMSSRMTAFDEGASAIFEQFYENTPLPPHIVHVTCTGYISPSPAQKIVSKRHSNTSVTHAYHMGCYGSIPAIRMVQGQIADIVHTELCTLHLNAHFHRSEQLVVQSLFADGFIKYSVVEKTDKPHFEILALEEKIIPDSITDMSWRLADWGMEMTLSKAVPIVIARALPEFIKKLSPQGEVFYAIHPGGPKIIEQIRDILKLEDHQIAHSVEIMKTFGNMSSATLPHIWEKMLKELPNGSHVISLAFGPGLTLCGALFKTMNDER